MTEYTANHIASVTDENFSLYVYQCKCNFVIGLDADWMNENGDLMVTCPCCGDILYTCEYEDIEDEVA